MCKNGGIWPPSISQQVLNRADFLSPKVRIIRDPHYLDPRVAQAYDADNQGSEITTDDLPFYLGLAREAAALGHGVLELACGTGRIALPIASEAIPVVGLDRSPAMLDIAKGKTGGAGNPRWVEADMTDFHLNERFGLVIIAFRSFMHLITVAEQEACLRLAKEHLVKGGRLSLNVINPEILPFAGQSTTLRRARYGHTSSQSAPQDGEPSRISRIHRGQRLRYVLREEMEHLLALTGFDLEAFYGWFDGKPFLEDSSELVCVARNAS